MLRAPDLPHTTVLEYGMKNNVSFWGFMFPSCQNKTIEDQAEIFTVPPLLHTTYPG
jgi:hypothetical protein